MVQWFSPLWSTWIQRPPMKAVSLASFRAVAMLISRLSDSLKFGKSDKNPRFIYRFIFKRQNKDKNHQKNSTWINLFKKLRLSLKAKQELQIFWKFHLPLIKLTISIPHVQGKRKASYEEFQSKMWYLHWDVLKLVSIKTIAFTAVHA